MEIEDEDIIGAAVDGLVGDPGLGDALLERAELLRTSTLRRALLRPYRAQYSVMRTMLGFDEVFLESGETRHLAVQPQRPFRGRWFLTHDPGPDVWVLDVRVGQCSFFVDCRNGVPATAWNLDAFREAFEKIGLVTVAEQIAFTENHPAFDRFRIDFDTCTVGQLMSVLVQNKGQDRQRFRASVHGQSLHTEPLVHLEGFAAERKREREAAFAVAGGVAGGVGGAGGGHPYSHVMLTRPDGSVEDPSSRIVEPPPKGPSLLIDPAEVPLVKAMPDGLQVTCRECGVGVGMPCFGLPRGQVHKRRRPR